MISEQERAHHITRVQDQLQKASRLVWENPGFPVAHRPDIDYLKSRIKIDNHRTPIRFHPAIKPEILTDLREQAVQLATHNSQTHVTWYDTTTRAITFHTKTLEASDETIRRFSYHAVALDNLNKDITIHAAAYSDNQKRRVDAVLQEAFDPRNTMRLEQTTIVKPGFREYLLVDGQFVCDLTPTEAIAMDQLYPTAFELITNQIVRHGGDINAFDLAAANGHLKAFGEDDHPHFTRRFFQALQFIDWRYLLDALKTGDLPEAVAILDAHAKRPAEGSGIFMALFETMAADEQMISSVIRMDRNSKSSSN